MIIRKARTNDIVFIKKLIDEYAGEIMLEKSYVTLYESTQEFTVAELDNEIIGCGALHVFWEDLGELRSVVVDKNHHGKKIGNNIVEKLIEESIQIGLKRLFVLTFEIDFFTKHGFKEIQGTPVEPEVFKELLQSYDAGVAEFLDLSYVKPNTLGNVRMLRNL